MDLEAIKQDAQKVLAGKDSEDWRGEAQVQARNLINVVDQIAEGTEKYEALRSSINSELAQLKAEKGDLVTQQIRTKAAESAHAELKDKFEKLASDYRALKLEKDKIEAAQQAILAAAEGVK